MFKRFPTAIIGAVVTVIDTALIVGPDLGLPTSVSRILALVVATAGFAGIHSRVTPVAAPKV